jgi:hypothetical protein
LKEVKVLIERFSFVPKNEKTMRMFFLMPWLMNDAYGLLGSIHQ